MLRGTSLAKIDAKGRLKLPAGFRNLIEPKWGRDFFVTSLRGDSARIYPLEVYARLEQALAENRELGMSRGRITRNLNFFGQSTHMDGQGRVLIHPRLRDKAELGGDVTVLGHHDHLVVWNQQAFEEHLDQDPVTSDDQELFERLGF